MPETSKKLDIDLEFLDRKESANTETAARVKTAPTEEESKSVQTNTAHPWIRYWARYIDTILFAIVFGIFLGIFMPSVLQLSNVVLTMLILFVWIFAESAILSTLGTTPGKWLLRINLEFPNGKRDFSLALNRCFAVWLSGLGLGIPIVSFFTLFSSYDHLIKEGITTWDREGHFSVTHGKFTLFRTIVAIVISILFLLLIFGGE